MKIINQLKLQFSTIQVRIPNLQKEGVSTKKSMILDSPINSPVKCDNIVTELHTTTHTSDNESGEASIYNV